ncbi:phenylacetate-CoA ligase [Candidatus Omnitrophus magneticus]|uniref:Phenylacetate-CoA ligase n=1 Tax=Candidatus Omnitrophus magneticus TaxID=1609969 RepID=A0A0F0CRN0_9BACT|nr:phenylacetate-CoA ligase [Candidatus Omnitrophus magneticus]
MEAAMPISPEKGTCPNVNRIKEFRTHHPLRMSLINLIRRTDAMRYYYDFINSQWYSHEHIQEIQFQNLKRLLTHAYNNVPYYRRTFNAHGLQVENIKDFIDFKKVPYLDKNIIKTNYADMFASNMKQFKPHPKSTGGSTGNPLLFYIDKKAHSMQWAYIYRAWNIGGWTPGEKVVVIGGTSLFSKTTAIRKWAYATINNWILFSAFDMSDDNMAAWVVKIRKFKARYMYTYANSVYVFADYIERKAINDITFDAIFTTSEVLTDKIRKKAEQVFSCKVYDEYGGSDGAGFAFECEMQKLHVVLENCVFEITNEDSSTLAPGEEGEICTTDLFNYGMPFIRYKTGDISSFSESPCSCGRGLPLLTNIKGRVSDYCTNKDGERVNYTFFDHMFKTHDWIHQFYVVQESHSKITIYFKTTKEYPLKELNSIRAMIQQKFSGFEVNIKMTNETPKTISGKHKYVINKTLEP